MIKRVLEEVLELISEKVTIMKITKLLVEKFLVNLTGGNLLLGLLLIA